MGWFNNSPKEEVPSKEDYDLNSLNEIHSRAKDFLNVQDYTAARWMVEERERYAKENGIDIRWDKDTDTFERRR